MLPSAALLPHAALLPQSIRCVMLEFHDFGKNELKTWGMSPDGCIQVAQLLRSVPSCRRAVQAPMLTTASDAVLTLGGRPLALGRRSL